MPASRGDVLLVNADPSLRREPTRAAAVAGLPRAPGQGRRRAGCGAAGGRLRRVADRRRLVRRGRARAGRPGQRPLAGDEDRGGRLGAAGSGRATTAGTASSITPWSRLPTTRSPTCWTRPSGRRSRTRPRPTAAAARRPSAASPSPIATATRSSCWPRRGCLRRSEGLGAQIGQKLLEGLFPVVMTPGEANITPAGVLKAAEHLRSRDGAAGQGQRAVARQPGPRHEGRVRPALGRERGPRHDAGRAAGRHRRPGRVGRADHRRHADHIVREMASY